MRITVIGAGPAGFYAAILLKTRRPADRVRLIEQQPFGVERGYGLIFSRAAIERLRARTPELCEQLLLNSEQLTRLLVEHRGDEVAVDGIEHVAMVRLRTMGVLQAYCEAIGVETIYSRRISDLAELPDADLIVGADGLSWRVRRQGQDAFGASWVLATNRFAWFGTIPRTEATLAIRFSQTAHGNFCATHYPYADPVLSTLIIEADGPTFHRTGLRRMSQEEQRRILADAFPRWLTWSAVQQPKWQQFWSPSAERWHAGNCVLIGDALRAPHHSVFNQTSAAIDDAAALADAVAEHGDDIASALAAFEVARRPASEALLRAADNSLAWFDRLAEHMELGPRDLALSYLRRTGEFDTADLTRIAPYLRAPSVAAPASDARHREFAALAELGELRPLLAALACCAPGVPIGRPLLRRLDRDAARGERLAASAEAAGLADPNGITLPAGLQAALRLAIPAPAPWSAAANAAMALAALLAECGPSPAAADDLFVHARHVADRDLMPPPYEAMVLHTAIGARWLDLGAAAAAAHLERADDIARYHLVDDPWIAAALPRLREVQQRLAAVAQ